MREILPTKYMLAGECEIGPKCVSTHANCVSVGMYACQQGPGG